MHAAGAESAVERVLSKLPFEATHNQPLALPLSDGKGDVRLLTCKGMRWAQGKRTREAFICTARRSRTTLSADELGTLSAQLGADGEQDNDARKEKGEDAKLCPPRSR